MFSRVQREVHPRMLRRRHFEICGGFEIIIADYDAFVEKWTKFFEKDKVQARQFLGAAEAKVYAKLIF